MIDRIWSEINELKTRYNPPKIGTWVLSFAEEYPCDIFSKETLGVLANLDYVNVSYKTEDTFINTELFKISRKRLEGEISELSN